MVGGGGPGGRPQTAHTESHRLHSPLYRSDPICVFLKFPPTERLSGSGTPISPSIYPFTSPSTSILPSCLLPLTCGTPSSIFVSHSSSVMAPHNIFDCYAALTSADSGKNYYLLRYHSSLSNGPLNTPSPPCPHAQRKRTYNWCLFSLNVRPVPSRLSCLQTSDHRALIGGLRGNSYHTAII